MAVGPDFGHTDAPMAIKLDPSSTGRIPREALFEAKAKEAKPDAKAPGKLRAMERPQMLATPQRAATQPVPSRAAGGAAEFQKQAQALSAQLRGKGPERLSAADKALALAGSYAMRRSKGARRCGIDLLEEVAEEVEERALLAKKLRHVLLAEAYLHQASPDSTLRAIRALVGMLDDETEEA